MFSKFKLSDLPEKVPLFPLPGALLLPHARLPLNIFEPRYLALLDDTLRTSDRLVGMIQPMSPGPPDQDERLHRIGCAGRITAMQETPDGRYLITLSGISRFRILDVEDGFTPYNRARVDWASFRGDLDPEEADDRFDRTAFLAVLARYFEATQLSSDWDSMKDADEEILVNSLSILCPFEPEEKQALLEAPTLPDRRETLLTLMEFALRGGGDDGAIQ